MAFSRSFTRNAKHVLLTLLAMAVIYLGIFLYYEVITVPYLSPMVVKIVDTLSPFTPLWNPFMIYINFKQCFNPKLKPYRASMKGYQRAMCYTGQGIAILAILFSISLNFSWVMETLDGLKIGEGMCVGPCWKVWTQLGLLAGVIIALVMRWEIDGGLCERLVDWQIERIEKERARKAEEEEAKACGGDLEKASTTEKA